MKKISKEEFEHSYKLHQKRLNGEEDGVRLSLSGYDLSGMNLSEVNLFGACLYKTNLTKADLCEANLCKANLSEVNLKGTNLCEADLSFANLIEAILCEANLWKVNLFRANLFRANLFRANLREAYLNGAYLTETYLRETDLTGADLSFANLTGANLTEADLTGANLLGVNLLGANLFGANLTNTKGLFSNQEWIDKNLEKVSEGYIVYKKIGKDTPYFKNLPKNWIIEEDNYLTEIVNPDRRINRSYGVSFGTYDWCLNNYPKSDLWKCLIEFEYISEVVVPYATNGKARCSKLKLLENLGRVYET